MTTCPCGSSKNYKSCCEPYLSGTANPPTAEALMRSRYTAYVKHEVDYIINTHASSSRDEVDRDETREWAQSSQWEGLEIVNCEAGGKTDQTGTVEFKAHYKRDGEDQLHHEVSKFVRQDGKWYFDEGFPATDTYVRDTKKVGRNDPCPCGSGKKYKKCCGAAV